jgi:hypothetical protein
VGLVDYRFLSPGKKGPGEKYIQGVSTETRLLTWCSELTSVLKSKRNMEGAEGLGIRKDCG